MKQFDIKEAFDGAKLVTKCGYKVKRFGMGYPNTEYCYMAIISENGRDWCRNYNSDGKNVDDKSDDYDLFILEEKDLENDIGVLGQEFIECFRRAEQLSIKLIEALKSRSN